MRYIGGKSLMLDNIYEVIERKTKNVNTIIDLFSGSGVVSTFFKQKGLKVISNDLLYFSYVLNRGSLCINKSPSFSNLGIQEPLEYLNNLTIESSGIDIEDCFIFQNYSPNKKCNRMYFQNKNAIKIDIIRLTIEKWFVENKLNEEEYYYLLATLVSAVPYVSNITGVYAAYLKHWDKRTFNDLRLKAPEIIKSRKKHLAFNEDSSKIINKIKSDVCYIDPPYNERQYLPNYHILETIAKYDYPEIKGVTGMREYDDVKSEFCQKSKVKQAFENLLDNINSKYIIISYNNESLLSTKDMLDLLKKYGKPESIELYEYEYRRYKNKIPNNKNGLKEQIYFIEKR